MENIAAVVFGLAVVAPAVAAAQAGDKPPAAKAVTQAAAAKATGRATTDAPAAAQPQGTAWAVKQAANGGAAAPPPAPAAAKVTPHGDMLATLAASGQFTVLLKALDATNLTSVLKTNTNLTLFAPTDAAFAALPPGELDQLMADKPRLQKLLTHHLINARVDAAKIKNARGPVPTVAGDRIELDGTGTTPKAGNADIVQADVAASNGLIHVVDQVLVPETGAAAAASEAGRPASAQAAAHGAGESR